MSESAHFLFVLDCHCTHARLVNSHVWLFTIFYGGVVSPQCKGYMSDGNVYFLADANVVVTCACCCFPYVLYIANCPVAKDSTARRALANLTLACVPIQSPEFLNH